MKTYTYCQATIRLMTYEDIYEIDPSCVEKDTRGKFIPIKEKEYFEKKMYLDCFIAFINYGNGKGGVQLKDTEDKIIYSLSYLEIMNYMGKQGWNLIKFINNFSVDWNPRHYKLIFSKEIEI